jgi:phage shock protein C
MAEKKMVRSTSNKMIAGVCAGLAEYLDLDPSLVRIIFVVLALFGGTTLIIYPIMWIILPEGPSIAGMDGSGGGAGMG